MFFLFSYINTLWGNIPQPGQFRILERKRMVKVKISIFKLHKLCSKHSLSWSHIDLSLSKTSSIWYFGYYQKRRSYRLVSFWKVPSHSPTRLKMVKPVKEKQFVHNTNTDITSKIFKRYTWVTSMSTCTMLQDVQMLLRAEHLCSTSKVLSYLHVSLLTMLVILTNCLTNSLVHRQPPPKFFHSMWQMDSRGQVNPENLVKHLSIESHTGLYIYQIRLQNWILCCCAKVSK